LPYVSTFCGYACVDLRADADVGPFLTELTGTVGAIPVAMDPPRIGSTIEFDGDRRFSLCADYGNIWLAHVIADVARSTGALHRAVIALDHDEFGAENIVIDGAPHRVHHVFVARNSEGLPTLLGVPARPGLPVAQDGTVDGPEAWAAAAELYGVPTDRLAKAAEETAPFAPWWEALGISYPGGE
jgi:hypothetical protein